MPKVFISEVQKVAATFSPTVDVKPGHVPLVATRRRIGIVAQSGGIGFAIKHRAKAIGVAISYVVSAGNECDLGAGEFFDYMVQDASTDVILLFIEGIRDVDKFLAAAQRAAEIGKPVIVTKVGRSGAGERAAASHTASMAGWSAAYDAVFAKYGFIVSNDLDEAVDHRRGADHQSAAERRPRRRAHGVRRRRHLGRRHGRRCRVCRCRNCRQPIQAEIMKLLPSYGAARNPIDVTAQGVNSGGLQKSIDLLDASDEVDAILVVLSLSSETRMPFKQAELKPVIDRRRTSRSCSIPTRCRRISRARELAKSGVGRAVGADPCRRGAAADGRAGAIQAGAAGRLRGVAARAIFRRI